jgi:hypothetical protein
MSLHWLIVHVFLVLSSIPLSWCTTVYLTKPSSFDKPLSFLSPSLFSGSTWCSRLTFYFPWPGTGINHFSLDPSSFYWRIVLINTDLSTRHAHCYWSVILKALSIDRARTYMYVYIYAQTTTCISDTMTKWAMMAEMKAIYNSNNTASFSQG